MSGEGSKFVPAKPGNTRAVKHGAYSATMISPRATEITAALENDLPWLTPADRSTVARLGWTLARIERLGSWLDQQELDQPNDHNRRELSALMNAAEKLGESLGMSPKSRASLGLAVARGESLAEELARMKASGDSARDRLAKIQEAADE